MKWQRSLQSRIDLANLEPTDDLAEFANASRNVTIAFPNASITIVKSSFAKAKLKNTFSEAAFVEAKSINAYA